MLSDKYTFSYYEGSLRNTTSQKGSKAHGMLKIPDLM